jgi:hypothetical protein
MHVPNVLHACTHMCAHDCDDVVAKGAGVTCRVTAVHIEFKTTGRLVWLVIWFKFGLALPNEPLVGSPNRQCSV